MLRNLESACAVALLTGIVILVGIAAVARSMGSPIIWSVEVAQLLFVWLCMLAADLAMQQRRHFCMSLLPDSLGPRGRHALEAVNLLIVIALLVFLWIYAWRNMVLMHPRLIGATQMNGSLIHASMVVGLLLLLRTSVAQLVAHLRNMAPPGKTDRC
ncbi:TRAP transporter small permease [Thalassobaculum litoreum]|uniref:TRAP transporter small permease protein n=1 Tax=Thalassobaculum litoreum DSM 18839 TaxID=1123362 RepID=A0A8G2BN19_9PROT|nr:TRAP transporter small permease subunit [Thalassobaculum litoreum]SDG22053.1 TRAP-type C4-dicarboxylate transport system, small permease component [Thalassobaculum litoreum DSM 18839]